METTKSNPCNSCSCTLLFEYLSKPETRVIAAHIFFLFILFSPQGWIFFGYPSLIPPVFDATVLDANKQLIILQPIDHLRFNIQWTVVIFSFYLYPAVASDRMPVRVRSRNNQEKETWPKWLRVLVKNDDAMKWLGIINLCMGMTTIGSYIYQTYQHESGNDWFGSEDAQKFTNLSLCIVDAVIDMIALLVVGVSIMYVPLAHQRLSYLITQDTLFLILGASSNLVYCIQVFYEFFAETKATPDPHTLTFFRIFPIVSFINWIAPRYLTADAEEWNLYAIGMRLFATCILVAGIMVTTERLGNPPSWDPSEDEQQGWTFFKSLWFVVVTTSTVGYGDFTTSTFFGRFATILVIFTGLPKFTQYAGKVYEIMNERKMGAGLIADVGSRPFIVLTGSVDLRLAQLWIDQLYGDPQNDNLVIVILSMTSEGPDILHWIRFTSNLKSKVYYIRGDVHDDDHLRRAKLLPDSPNCKGVFLLCRAGSAGDDASNVMRLQGLRNHVSPNKIYVNLRDSVRSFNHVKLQGLDSKANVFALDHLLWSMLGANVDSPGVICLVTMLLTKEHTLTVTDTDTDSNSNTNNADDTHLTAVQKKRRSKLKKLNAKRKRNNQPMVTEEDVQKDELNTNKIGMKERTWKSEYEDGFDFDLCVSDWIPDLLNNKTFNRAAMVVFEQVDMTHDEEKRMTLMGICLKKSDGSTRVLLNPMNVKIDRTIHSGLIFIARNSEVFDSVFQKRKNHIEISTPMPAVTSGPSLHEIEMVSARETKTQKMKKSKKKSKKKKQHSEKEENVSDEDENTNTTFPPWETAQEVIQPKDSVVGGLSNHIIVCGLEDEPQSFPYFLYALQTGSYMRNVDAMMSNERRIWNQRMKNKEGAAIANTKDIIKNIQKNVQKMVTPSKTAASVNTSFNNTEKTTMKRSVSMDDMEEGSKHNEEKETMRSLTPNPLPSMKSSLASVLSSPKLLPVSINGVPARGGPARGGPARGVTRSPRLVASSARGLLPRGLNLNNVVRSPPLLPTSITTTPRGPRGTPGNSLRGTPRRVSRGPRGGPSSISSSTATNDSHSRRKSKNWATVEKSVQKLPPTSHEQKHAQHKLLEKERPPNFSSIEEKKRLMNTNTSNGTQQKTIDVVLVLPKRPSSFWWSQVTRVAKDIQITLYLCVGDALQSMVLSRISAHRARSVVVLPNDLRSRTSTMNSADATAVLITQAFESFTEKEWIHSEPGHDGKNYKTFEHVTTVLTINDSANRFPSMGGLSLDWTSEDDATLCRMATFRNFDRRTNSQDWEDVSKHLIAMGKPDYIGGHLVTTRYLQRRWEELENWWNDEMTGKEKWNPYGHEGWPHCNSCPIQKTTKCMYKTRNCTALFPTKNKLDENNDGKDDMYINIRFSDGDNEDKFVSVYDLTFFIEINTKKLTSTRKKAKQILEDPSIMNPEKKNSNNNVKFPVKYSDLTENDISKLDFFNRLRWIDRANATLTKHVVQWLDSNRTSTRTSSSFKKKKNTNKKVEWIEKKNALTGEIKFVKKKKNTNDDNNNNPLTVSNTSSSGLNINWDQIKLNSPWLYNLRLHQRKFEAIDCERRYRTLIHLQNLVTARHDNDNHLRTARRFASGRVMAASTLQYISSSTYKDKITLKILEKMLGSNLVKPNGLHWNGARRQIQLEDLPNWMEMTTTGHLPNANNSNQNGNGNNSNSEHVNNFHANVTNEDLDENEEEVGARRQLECAACSAAFVFGTVYKAMLRKEKKIIIGVLRRPKGHASLPYVILCPPLTLRLQSHDRLFVVYQDMKISRMTLSKMDNKASAASKRSSVRSSFHSPKKKKKKKKERKSKNKKRNMQGTETKEKRGESKNNFSDIVSASTSGSSEEDDEDGASSEEDVAKYAFRNVVNDMKKKKRMKKIKSMIKINSVVNRLGGLVGQKMRTVKNKNVDENTTEGRMLRMKTVEGNGDSKVISV